MSYFNYQSKNIYYAETGNGKPVAFLHGNTASSKMFEPLLPLYEEYFRVSLVGSSGGAWAAVNAGLLSPDLVEKVVTDSFDGRTLGKDFARKLTNERTGAKQDEQAAQEIRNFLSRTDAKND